MKKILLLFCFCASGYGALCQKVDVGILAGPNVSDTYFHVDYNFPQKTTWSAVSGFHAGAFLQIAAGSIYVQPGLLYESIGGKIHSSYDYYDGSGTGTANYTVHIYRYL